MIAVDILMNYGNRGEKTQPGTNRIRTPIVYRHHAARDGFGVISGNFSGCELQKLTYVGKSTLERRLQLTSR